MGSSSVLKNTFDIGDAEAPKGSEAWCRWLHFETLRRLDDREESGKRLEWIVSTIQESEAFSKLTDRNGRPFIDFADYCQAPPPYGLGRTPDVIHKEIKLRTVGRPTGDEKGNNVTISPKRRGNDSSYTVARLERDRPDLAAKVEAGDLSANAAAIEAGFRSKTATVPLTVEGATRLMLRLSDDERDEVIARVLKAAS